MQMWIMSSKHTYLKLLDKACYFLKHIVDSIYRAYQQIITQIEKGKQDICLCNEHLQLSRLFQLTKYNFVRKCVADNLYINDNGTVA